MLTLEEYKNALARQIAKFQGNTKKVVLLSTPQTHRSASAIAQACRLTVLAESQETGICRLAQTKPPLYWSTVHGLIPDPGSVAPNTGGLARPSSDQPPSNATPAIWDSPTQRRSTRWFGSHSKPPGSFDPLPELPSNCGFTDLIRNRRTAQAPKSALPLPPTRCSRRTSRQLDGDPLDRSRAAKKPARSIDPMCLPCRYVPRSAGSQ